jgi:anti-anti-sigma factor
MSKGDAMDIQTTKEKGVTVVRTSGRIDAVTAPEFEKRLAELIAEGENVFILNFSGLEYISSAGLRSILTTAKQLKPRDGKLLFAELQGSVKDVFRISGFGSLFNISETQEEALGKI